MMDVPNQRPTMLSAAFRTAYTALYKYEMMSTPRLFKRLLFSSESFSLNKPPRNNVESEVHRSHLVSRASTHAFDHKLIDT